MNIPKDAMEPMINMIINSLPYHDELEPKTYEGQLLTDFMGSIEDDLPLVKQLKGFVWFNVANLEKSEKQRENLRSMVNIVEDCINRYQGNIMVHEDEE